LIFSWKPRKEKRSEEMHVPQEKVIIILFFKK